MNSAVFLFGLICILSIPGAESDEIACPRQVNETVYGQTSFKCYYSTTPKANKYARKFCCLQGLRPGRCKYTIVSDSGYTADRFVERISLVDTPNEGYFTIELKGLEMEDSGTYICGIGPDENGIKGVLRLSVLPGDSEEKIPDNAELVYAKLRGTMVFKCTGKLYSTRKHLCKVGKNGCTNIIDSAGNVDSKYEGRILADKQTVGTFAVKLAGLRLEDAGYYICGSDDPEESKTLPKYDLRINEETNIPQGSRLLTPRLGGSLSAQCNYNPEMKYTEKYWCKLDDGYCNPIVRSGGYVMGAFEGRVLMYDDPTNGLIQILMNGITKDDAGWYWCVMTDGKNDQTSVVQVRISDENLPELSANRMIQVTAGAPIRITCSYPCRFKKAEKYWCRWSNHGCEPLSNVQDTQDRESVNCKTEDLVLILNSVSQAQSGYYWCGVKDGSRYGESVVSHLIVDEPKGDVSNADSKTDLRANFDSGSRRNVPVMVSPPSTSDKSSSVTAAVVSVCVVVLVVGAVIVFLRIRKRKNSDLVSVGSYRTNISMTDLDHNIGKENPAVTDLQETDIGRNEGSPKTKKKGSREDLDYSSFLINSVGNPNEQVA